MRPLGSTLRLLGEALSCVDAYFSAKGGENPDGD